MERLEPLRNALAQLQSTVALIDQKATELPAEMRLIYQTAAIKSFEYVYEISIRLIRRHLERTSDSALLIEKMDFKPLIRTAAEKGLVDDPVRWFLYREKRNITAHTYDAVKAMDILTVLPEFMESVQGLLDAVARANDTH